jgi:tryptophan synthase alpha chain
MSSISSVFRPGYKALIAYLTVGYPGIEATQEIASTLADNGCDIIELGIPFSDPLADGTTIQKASHRALQQGVNPQVCLEVASQLHQKMTIPLVFMTYYNPVFNFGLEAFCRSGAEAGISGLIIPDLPPEEGVDLEAATRKHDLDLIYLLAPTSSEARIALVAERSRGFIYLVSLTGVTGARQSLPSELESFVTRVKQKAKQPLCVGFGVSNPEQASRAAAIADGVIVGSRFIQLVEEDATLNSLKDFTASLRGALNKKNKEQEEQ